MKILVVGGAGYIGSQVVLDLLRGGHEVVVADNLSSGLRESVHPAARFVHCDVCDERQVAGLFADKGGRGGAGCHFDVVMHFAAKLSVPESMEQPLLYWRENVGGLQVLLDAMLAAGVRRLVFSSTAAVYGEPKGAVALTEDAPKRPINPYGETKLACEAMIRDSAKAFGLQYVVLRYFNAAGADASLRLGLLKDSYHHLIPLAVRAALGLGEPLTVCGDDYPTPDGTCVRDYVHVADLSAAHIVAAERLMNDTGGVGLTLNLGTQRGCGIYEVLEAVDRLAVVPFSVGGRRAGDPAVLVADSSLARIELGWQARRGLDEIVGSDFAFRSEMRSVAERDWPL